MEPALELVVATQRVPATLGMSQHMTRLSRQSAPRGTGRDPPAMRSLPGNTSHCASSDRRHRLQQVTGPRIPVENSRHSSDTLGQPGSGFHHRPGNLGQRLSRHGRDRPGHNRQQFAGSHANQGQEVFRSLFFGLGFESQLAHVLHHCVRIDTADGADFFFRFEFALAFAEQAAGDIADGAQPALALDFLFPFALDFLLALESVFFLILLFGFAEQAAGDIADGAQPAFALDFLFEFFFAFSLDFSFELFF